MLGQHGIEGLHTGGSAYRLHERVCQPGMLVALQYPQNPSGTDPAANVIFTLDPLGSCTMVPFAVRSIPGAWS